MDAKKMMLMMDSCDKYDLMDDFISDKSAGGVNGTACEPGPGGNRVVADTGNKLAVSNGYAETTATGTAADPSLKYPGIQRIPGKTMSLKITPSINNAANFAGLLKAATVTAGNCMGIFCYSDGSVHFGDYDGAGNDFHDNVYVAGSEVDYAIMMRDTGYFHFIRKDNIWRLGMVSDIGATATLYPAFSPWNNPSKIRKIRVFRGIKPTPCLSDGFSSSVQTDGIGHPEANGGSGLIPTDLKGTFGVTGGVAQATALDGTWGEAIRSWNVLKNCVVAQATLTRTAGQVGIMAMGRDANNCLIVCHDGTRVKICAHLRGGALSTLYQTGGIAFGAGKLKIWIFRPANGRTYINGRWDNTPFSWSTGQLVCRGELQTGTNVGIYSSDLGNTIDNFVVYPTGQDGEYGWLDRKTDNTQTWKSEEKFVLFDGNSLTAGSNVSTDYASVCLASLGASYRGFTMGIGGQNGYQMLSDTFAASYYNPNRTKNIYVYWEGINDFTTYSGEDSYQHTYDRCLAMKQLGYRVVVLTCHKPGGKSAEFYTKRTNYNNLVITNYASFSDAIVRIDQNAIIGDSGDPTNTTYFNADQIHLTAAGYAIVAGLVKTGIEAV